MEDNKVNISESEIVKALQIIKQECLIHPKCSDCPFYVNDVCRIKYSDPEQWEIELQFIWRAFK